MALEIRRKAAEINFDGYFIRYSNDTVRNVKIYHHSYSLQRWERIFECQHFNFCPLELPENSSLFILKLSFFKANLFSCRYNCYSSILKLIFQCPFVYNKVFFLRNMGYRNLGHYCTNSITLALTMIYLRKL